MSSAAAPLRRRSHPGYGRLICDDSRRPSAAGGALRVTALLILLISLFALPATAGAAVSGGLKQRGCLSGDTPTTSGCSAVRGLQNAGKMAMTKDGKSVYLASRNKNAIIAFTRNAAGGLVQPSGITGCYTNLVSTQTDDGCILATANADALSGVTAVAVSPDGRSLYASTNNGFATVFKRATDGTLTYVSTLNLHGSTGSNSFPALTVAPDGKTVYVGGPGGYGGILWMLSRDTSGGASHGTLGSTLFNCIAVSVCGTNVPNMGSPSDVAVTPDNRQVIVAGGESTYQVVALDRNTTSGALTANATADHCVTASTGLANCTTRNGQLFPRALAIASNRDIYVGGYYSLSLIQRNATANTIAPVASADSCVAYEGSGITDCTEGVNCNAQCLGRATVVSPDGKNIYEGTDNNGAVLAFSRNTSSGAFSRNTTPLGCLSATTVDRLQQLRAGHLVSEMTIDPTGRFVYAAGDNRACNFAVDRPPVCSNVSAGTVNTAAVTVDAQLLRPRRGCPDLREAHTGPIRGSLADIQGNAVSYGPQPGTSGVDSFQYRARAAGVSSDPATASINVTAPPTGGAAPRPPPRRRRRRRCHDPGLNDELQLARVQEVHEVPEPVGQQHPGRRDRHGDVQDQEEEATEEGLPLQEQALQGPHRAHQVQPAQALRQEAGPGRSEDHDPDRRTRLPEQADHLHDPQAQASVVARALHLPPEARPAAASDLRRDRKGVATQAAALRPPLPPREARV